MLDFSVLDPYLPLLASAVWITIKFTFFSTLIGFLGGFILALITLSHNKVFSFLAKAYISVFRGTPLLVQLMLIAAAYWLHHQCAGSRRAFLRAELRRLYLRSTARRHPFRRPRPVGSLHVAWRAYPPLYS